MPEQLRRGRFDTTSWSLVVAAAGTPQTRSDAALEELCARYWHPVHAFIRRHHPDDAHAEDLTQSFFARLIEKNYVAQADRTRGRFRTFLLTAVRNFVLNEVERANTQKRGGRVAHVALDEGPDRRMQQATPTPEALFHRRWALTLLNEVVAQLRKDAIERDGERQLDLLLPFVTGDAARNDYAELASQTGTSAGALRVAVHRLRMQFRDRLRAAVAATLTDPADLDDEIRFLIEAVSSGAQADEAR
ncbi:MAG: sigma-70 family RNA polymerase sigma factor [Thermoanaerobaculia bacterium]